MNDRPAPQSLGQPAVNFRSPRLVSGAAQRSKVVKDLSVGISGDVSNTSCRIKGSNAPSLGRPAKMIGLLDLGPRLDGV